MAKVSVLNMEGSEVGTIELSDAVFGVEVNENLVHQAVVSQLAKQNAREHRKLKLVQKLAVAEENHGDRKELVMQDRVQQDLHSGQAVELYSLQHQEIIHLRWIRKKRD